MSRLSFWDHIEELRKMLIRCGCVIVIATAFAFFFHKEIVDLLTAPLGIEELYILTPLEGFSCVVKLSFWAGVLLSSPIWLYSLINFLLPALRIGEKKLLLPFLALSTFFIGGGIFFAYKITLPYAIQFFQKFNEGLGENLWGLGKTIDLTIGLMLAHGLVFELYVLLLFLIQFRLLPHPLLKKGRKGVYVCIFILAALLTPPDVLSQLLLAFPMVLLFESAIFYAKLTKHPF